MLGFKWSAKSQMHNTGGSTSSWPPSRASTGGASGAEEPLMLQLNLQQQCSVPQNMGIICKLMHVRDFPLLPLHTAISKGQYYKDGHKVCFQIRMLN